jgi:hypothetical protein
MSSRSIEPRRSDRRVRTIAPRTVAARGIEAIKTTLQKAAIHRDRRDRRRTPYFAAGSVKFRTASTGSPPRRRFRWFCAQNTETTGIFAFQPYDPTSSRSHGLLISRDSPAPRGPPVCKHRLLKLNLGAGFFQLRLDLVGLVLVHAFLDRLGRALDQVLGFLEAKTGDRTDLLDHLDLLLAGSR